MARREILGGLVLAAAIAAGARAVEGGLVGVGVVGVSAVFVAIVLGLVVRQVVAWPGLLPGSRFAADTVLKVGIVLLGARFNLDDLRIVGSLGAVAIGAALLAAALVTAVVLYWQLVPRRLALLIAVGTAICGNSAIAATAPVLGANDEEVSYASATITLFGMALVVVLPVLGQALGLTAQQFGIMAGAGVHDSAQAIATGFIYAPASGEVATVTKLARTMVLIPVVMGLSVAVGEPRGADGRRVRDLVPWFAVGFVGLTLLRTLGEVLAPSSGLLEAIVGALGAGATICILVAMAGVGLSTRLGNLRQMGLRPMLVGLAGALAVTGTAGVVATRIG